MFKIINILFIVWNLSEINCFKVKQLSSSALKEGPYTYDMEAIKERRTEYPIHPMILGRRSLKEMSGEEMTDKELFPLFEAAKWAPSLFNIQEWRMVYAKRNTKRWNKFLSLLEPANRVWAKDASALIVLMSNRFNTYKGKKSIIQHESFDTGAAWMAMALEGTARGYVVHAMAGFDAKKAARAVRMPNNGEYNVEVMIAVGKRRDPNNRTKEKISQRKSLSEIVSEGSFSSKLSSL